MTEQADKTQIKIMIIDDEPGIRSLLSYELGLQGYSVSTATNGEEGVDLIKKDKFNLVISDIKMPKMDGLQVLEAVKNINPDIEVIMITGFGTIGTAVNAIKKGAYDFIQKPFNLDELLTLVDKALEKAELKALVALYETSKAIFSSIKIDDLMPTLIDLSMKLLKSEDISIMLRDINGELQLSASSGLETESDKVLRLKIAQDFLNNIHEHSSVSNIISPIEDKKSPDTTNAKQIKSAILCPLLSRSKSLGVLCAARTISDTSFSSADQRYADIFASQISQALDNAQLFADLESKVTALNEAYGKLSEIHNELIKSEKLAAVGQLSAGVAHELNNPLTVVIGLAELLLDSEDVTGEKRTDLESIKKQAERCRSIILNLLQFAQKNDTEKKPVQINSLLEKTIELWSYNTQNSKISIIKDLDPKLPMTAATQFQIQQVFINIMNNANFALINKPDPKIRIRTFFEDNKIRISFTDNGSGIPENITGKIFDPFFTTKEVGKGTGLGLSITYGIIKEHNGDIKVQSKLNEGSTFTVELPVSNPS
jgi:signal transduction histidine kinase/DNA-binding response OmpR family regulator